MHDETTAGPAVICRISDIGEQFLKMDFFGAGSSQQSEWRISDGCLMTASDYSMAAFALLNGARVIAYAPQIRCLARDHGNAASVSLVTWGLFALANAATVAYALVVINDALMAAIFVLNLLGCLTIVVMIAKRRIHGSYETLGPPSLDVSATTLLQRLMLRWRRRAEKKLELHLRLTLPTHRLGRRQAGGPAIYDRCRHHLGIRE